MFLNHSLDFKTFTASPLATDCALTPETLVETPQGWRSADTLCIGDSVATLDGGFAPLTRLAQDTAQEPLWLLPGGTLDNCSDLILPGTQYVALDTPECQALYDAPYVLAPIAAMAGFRNIKPAPQTVPQPIMRLGFAEEEVIYAQSGTLIHAPCDVVASGFFRRLNYGETRAALIMMNRGLCAPDRAAA